MMVESYFEGAIAGLSQEGWGNAVGEERGTTADSRHGGSSRLVSVVTVTVL